MSTLSYQIKTRLFVDAALPGTGTIGLDADRTHFLATVLRARVGDQVALFNGRDGEWLASITQASRKQVVLRLERALRPQPEEVDLWYLFAPLKKARLDYMAQKATEMGASLLQPVMTRRTVADRVKLDRLQANAVEAAEQCTRLSVPTVADPVGLDKLLADWPDDRKLMFCDECADDAASLTQLRAAGSGKWAVLIGPEGGFDPGERQRLLDHPQAVPVALGPRILRADTAAVAALTLWQLAVGDWTKPPAG